MKQTTFSVRQSEARNSVQVSLPDGRVYEGRRGAPLRQFVRKAYHRTDDQPVAAIVDGKLRELGVPVVKDIEATAVFLSESDGMRIYCRSLSFLLVAAAHKLFPEARVFVDYSVPYGGYFCQVKGRAPFSSHELDLIEREMVRMVEDDCPIVRESSSLDKARALFSERGEDSKVRLLSDCREDHIHLYSLGGFLDYFYGYMLPSAGYLKTFALEQVRSGFVLRFPRRENPRVLLPPQDFPALREVFDEYGSWLEVMGIPDVGSLNAVVRQELIEQTILVAEALHERRIAEIARIIAQRHEENHQLVFIAGPSSSGKTTFSKRLAVQLIAGGLSPCLIALDDYFLPRDQLKMGRNGDLDFDSLAALDLPLFKSQLHKLLTGMQAVLPRYNFKTGKREQGETLSLAKGHVLIVEGIHALNPVLRERIDDDRVTRIFVSALTQLNLDSHNRVPTTDTRLIRRIVRDSIYRGYTAEETIRMWEDVREGEKKNIFPYQEQADLMFNSALVYELAELKPRVEPLLLQVRSTRQRIEGERLLAFLEWFQPHMSSTIPGNSILREFIGGSTLRTFNFSLANLNPSNP